jgi:hypothetical protein
VNALTTAKEAGIALLDEYAQHPSLRTLALGRYTVMTF